MVGDLTSSHAKEILVSGDRAEDMQLRLKYAGATEDMISIVRTDEELLQRMKQSGRPVFVMPNYTSMLSLRKTLSEATGGKEFWK